MKKPVHLIIPYICFVNLATDKDSTHYCFDNFQYDTDEFKIVYCESAEPLLTGYPLDGSVEFNKKISIRSEAGGMQKDRRTVLLGYRRYKVSLNTRYFYNEVGKGTTYKNMNLQAKEMLILLATGGAGKFSLYEAQLIYTAPDDVIYDLNLFRIRCESYTNIQSIIRMKFFILLYAICLLSAFFTADVSAQNQYYIYADKFAKGQILFPDSTAQRGYINWSGIQNDRLKYKQQPAGEIVKYQPKEIFGFKVDNLQFVTLRNVKVIAYDYALLGLKTREKQIFGKLIFNGEFQIYLIQISAYNPIGGYTDNVLNFAFRNNDEIVCYPYGLRMRSKRYKNAKEDLIALFDGYPEVIAAIEQFKKTDSFDSILNAVQNIR